MLWCHLYSEADESSDSSAETDDSDAESLVTTRDVQAHVVRLAEEALSAHQDEAALSASESVASDAVAVTDTKEDFVGTQSVLYAFARHCREHGFPAEPFF